MGPGAGPSVLKTVTVDAGPVTVDGALGTEPRDGALFVGALGMLDGGTLCAGGFEGWLPCGALDGLLGVPTANALACAGFQVPPSGDENVHFGNASALMSTLGLVLGQPRSWEVERGA